VWKSEETSGGFAHQDALFPRVAQLGEELCDRFEVARDGFREAVFVKGVQLVRQLAAGFEVEAADQFDKHRADLRAVAAEARGDTQVVELGDELLRRGRGDGLLLVLTHAKGGVHLSVQSDGVSVLALLGSGFEASGRVGAGKVFPGGNPFRGRRSSGRVASGK